MDIAAFLKHKPVVLLDGAMGSELQRRGFPTALPLWSAEANMQAAELVKQIHCDYIQAGADIITANTFRTTKYTYAKVNRERDAIPSAKRAIAIARSAMEHTEKKIWLAASMTTLEDCYEPGSRPPEHVLKKHHRNQARLLKEAGADLLLVETINSVTEAAVAAQAAYQSGIPWMISFVSNGKGELLNGEPMDKAVEAVRKYQPTAILLNCRSLPTLDADIVVLNTIWKKYSGAYANGYGNADDDWGWTIFDKDHSVEEFASYAKRWVHEGIKLIGGCCGTTPEHIHALYHRIIQ